MPHTICVKTAKPNPAAGIVGRLAACEIDELIPVFLKNVRGAKTPQLQQHVAYHNYRILGRGMIGSARSSLVGASIVKGKGDSGPRAEAMGWKSEAAAGGIAK